MPFVDTHAHVFLQSLPMAPNRRYTPGYDASAMRYLQLLADHDAGHGVIIQPSFLGTDNSYLLSALHTGGNRLRGVAVVNATVSDHELAMMDALGVVGIRFNMIGRDISEITTPDIRALTRRISALGWHIEVQARGNDIPAVFRALDTFDGTLVIDHFGLPDPAYGTKDPGFMALLREGARGRTFVKISASYRCGGNNVRYYTEALLKDLGPRRLLWGSDWPWTQFEAHRTYAGVVAELASLVPDYGARTAIDTAALALFRFSDGLHRITRMEASASQIGRTA
jgi:predicted TIM-barrel fold metal-dependent hydrolase